jgi:hypothetical protein
MNDQTRDAVEALVGDPLPQKSGLGPRLTSEGEGPKRFRA